MPLSGADSLGFMWWWGLEANKTDSCLANVVGFNKVDLYDDMDLLMSEKEQLPVEDLVELDKEAEGEGTEEDDW